MLQFCAFSYSFSSLILLQRPSKVFSSASRAVIFRLWFATTYALTLSHFALLSIRVANSVQFASYLPFCYQNSVLSYFSAASNFQTYFRPEDQGLCDLSRWILYLLYSSTFLERCLTVFSKLTTSSILPIIWLFSPYKFSFDSSRLRFSASRCSMRAMSWVWTSLVRVTVCWGELSSMDDCKISLQLTMSRRPMRGTAEKHADEPLASMLKINSQYAQLLQQLAENNTRASSLSPHAYLFDTLQSVKQLNACMKGQLKQYDQFCSPALQNFLERRQLADSSNLIGKYEGLNDEVEVFQERLRQLEDSKEEEKAFEAVAEEEEQLEAELRKLTARRIDLRNKNQMIEYQIECGEGDLNSLKARNYEQEITLRKMENSLKDRNRK